MTDAELREFVDQFVEVRFVHGKTVMGRLSVERHRPMLTTPYAVELPPAAENEGATWFGIPDAAVVEWARRLPELPETID
jgi:hypothetical protein